MARVLGAWIIFVSVTKECYIEVNRERELNLLIMKISRKEQARLRKEAEALLENNYVEQIKQGIWGVYDKDGNLIDKATSKTHGLYHACVAEGKKEQILAI